MPSAKSISQIKSALLHPATTSHFEVEIGLPKKLTTGGYLRDNGVNLQNGNIEKLNLLCSEATLPGSNLATLEITGDFHGVTERHAYRRVYDDRIDLTFYVDAENYLPIRVFETWMKYIAQESSVAPQTDRGGITSRSNEYFYRFQYIDEYTSQQGLSITKFERSSYSSSSGSASSLRYDFVKSYPISVSSMPVSYDSSSLLKCTVSMSYIRYIVNRTDDPPQQKTGSQLSTPIEQAAFNNAPDYFLNPQFGVEGAQGNPRNGVANDFLNVGNSSLEQFGVRDQLGRGAEGTIGANVLA